MSVGVAIRARGVGQGYPQTARVHSQPQSLEIPALSALDRYELVDEPGWHSIENGVALPLCSAAVVIE